MKNSQDPTARVTTRAILQDGEDVTRELVMVDGKTGLSLVMQFDTDKANAQLGMTLSLMELDVVLDQLHEIRDALQARVDAKPVFTARYPVTTQEMKDYDVHSNQLIVRDADGRLMAARTQPIPGRGLRPAREAIKAAGYEIVSAVPGSDGVFQYTVRPL